MSIHTSLKVSSAGNSQRNVWSRVERIAALKKAGRWSDGDKVLGLPKVRTSFKVKAKKRDTGEAKAEAPAKGKK